MTLDPSCLHYLLKEPVTGSMDLTAKEVGFYRTDY